MLYPMHRLICERLSGIKKLQSARWVRERMYWVCINIDVAPWNGDSLCGSSCADSTGRVFATIKAKGGTEGDGQERDCKTWG